MPDYFEQAKPYDVGNVPDISGTLVLGQQLKNQNLRLSLAEMENKREQARFEQEMDPETLRRKARAQMVTLDAAELEHQKNALTVALRFGPEIQWDAQGKEVQGFKDMLRKVGFGPHVVNMIPDRFNSPQELEAWKSKATQNTKLLLQEAQAALAIKKATGYESPAEKRKAEAAAEGETNIEAAALQAFKKKNPNATPEQLVALKQQLKGKGVKMKFPDGTEIEIGGASEGLTKKTQGVIEEKLLGGKEQLARMQAIASDFKPEYQEIGTRLGAVWTGIKAKLGKDVPEDDEQQLVAFKKYQRKSIENINLYIKEMTGAQMSEKEADRLRLAQPDPGEKWWQGDDPITFQAKMNDVIKGARAAVARYDYYRSKGLGDSEIEGLINSNSAVSLESIMEQMK